MPLWVYMPNTPALRVLTDTNRQTDAHQEEQAAKITMLTMPVTTEYLKDGGPGI